MAKKALFTDKVYNAALYLDVGKISIMDTVIIYGRDRIYPEEEAYKMHPDMSVHLLKKHASTRAYAEIAGMHYKSIEEIKDKAPDDIRMYALICQMAASIDEMLSKRPAEESATETVKILRREILGGRGDKYEPCLAALFNLPEFTADLAFLMDNGTEDSYRNTYLLLNDVRVARKQDLDSRLDGFIVRTARIRELSVPQLEDIGEPAEYGILLKQHFQEIGMLATENKRILERNVYPLLEPGRKLRADEAASLKRFCDELQKGNDLSDIDQSLVYRCVLAVS